MRHVRARGVTPRSGDGRFAVRSGLWPWALRSCRERAARPVGIALRGRPGVVSHWVDGGLHVRVVPGPSPAPAVVLVHGVVVSSRYLLPLAVELAGEAPILIPDLPGH